MTGEDWNGNLTIASVLVLRPATGSDIATFALTPDDRQVTLTWDPVLHTESYNLHSPRFGQIRTGVTSPYVWDGLTNGSAGGGLLHLFEHLQDNIERMRYDEYEKLGLPRGSGLVEGPGSSSSASASKEAACGGRSATTSRCSELA